MSARLENRVRELERQVRELLAERARVNQRVAAPMAARNGLWLGVTSGDLEQGGTVSVRTMVFSKGLWTWGPTIANCHDFYLNEGETIEQGTKVIAYWYRTCWVILGPYCTTTDTPPQEYY